MKNTKLSRRIPAFGLIALSFLSLGYLAVDLAAKGFWRCACPFIT